MYERRRLFSFAFTTAIAIFLSYSSSTVWAEDSNRNEVRRNLEDGWSVIWGKNFTEADWARGSIAIAESVAAENPGPFLAWFEQTLNENFAKIESNLRTVSRADLQRMVLQSLKQKSVVQIQGLEIQAGFATYDRWNRIVYDEPRTRKIPRPPFIEYYTERVEKRTNLPNWHQFYVRYKLTINPGQPVQNPGQQTATHTRWSGQSGVGNTTFQKEGSIWVEYNPRAGARFTEQGRNGDTVYLYDSSRNMNLALDNSKMLWRIGNGQWNQMFTGRWQN